MTFWSSFALCYLSLITASKLCTVERSWWLHWHQIFMSTTMHAAPIATCPSACNCHGDKFLSHFDLEAQLKERFKGKHEHEHEHEHRLHQLGVTNKSTKLRWYKLHQHQHQRLSVILLIIRDVPMQCALFYLFHMMNFGVLKKRPESSTDIFFFFFKGTTH